MQPGEKRIAAVRRFNRFYTGRIGLLDEGLLDTPYSLSEARVLYELAQRGEPTLSELGQALRLDLGYLSRLVRALERRGLLGGRRSDADARRRHLKLTPRGRRAASLLDARSRADVRSLLGKLAEPRQARLIEAMDSVQRLLGAEDSPSSPCVLRAPRAGDMGWVVERHGALYYEEFGWNLEFEGMVAEIVARFVQRFDPKRERCWIAERDGTRLGSVFLVKQSPKVAKLRLLLLEPAARGQGIGKRLVGACVEQARKWGYRKIVLWTQSDLTAARAIYAKSGFKLVREARHRGYGHPLVGEYWERDLD
jgi:DNA-binding MarR family transcriptional regulator/GNAT superfamily N-acetyltransferase